MIHLFLTLFMSVYSLSMASDASDEIAPGTLRLVETAQSLTDSSDAPLLQIHSANAWLATTTADIGGVPPKGPPDSVTATPRSMADWAMSCINAAAALGNNQRAVAYAQKQTTLISKLLEDVDRTGTEPPDPPALAQVQLLAGELAWVNDDTKSAEKFAIATGETMNWEEDVFITDSILLSRLLAKLGRCDLLERMASTIPPRQIPALIASAASQKSCYEIANKLLDDPSLGVPGRIERLLYELKKISGGEVTESAIARFPDILQKPQNRLVVAETLLTDGRIQRGLKVLGGEDVLARLRGYDSTNIHLALCLGYVKKGQLTQASSLITSINSLDGRFHALVDIDSRLLATGSIEPENVLSTFKTLRFVRTMGMDSFLPLMAKRPAPINLVLNAVIASQRFELAATLLTPLFAAKNQTGDEWLERRISILANSLADSDPHNNDAWSHLLKAISWCSKIDSQVKALCAIASSWNRSRPMEAFPASLKASLNETVERIAINDHSPQRMQ